jgi:hypothetical protein
MYEYRSELLVSMQVSPSFLLSNVLFWAFFQWSRFWDSC